ncbi:histidine kinase [Streptomyces sp. CB03238]|uniref:sensor histidine kinase n=1 Tax=Streptomyces sp. CB03238 TaxID=1907777 RepID=UPI001F4EAC4C|nr:histidine kinase [Streptomyces sp. CB03238]
MNAASGGGRADVSTGRAYAGEIPAPRLARGITVFAVMCFVLILVTNMVSEKPGTLKLVVFLVCIAVIGVLQFLHSSRGARRWPLKVRAATLGVQAAATFVPPLAFEFTWGSMWGCLAGSLLLLLPRRAGLSLFALCVATSVAFAVRSAPDVLYIVYLVQSTILSALVIYGFTKLADLVDEVHSSRAELARMAVTQERLRFSRDLHDLLGYSLSALTLKGELIHRLILTRPGQARQETSGLLEVARQALADVRLVASGYREMSLRGEAESAVGILEAADIRVELAMDHGRLHPLVDTVLATALREGVTNVLRHSKVQTCRIAAAVDGETVRLSLVNDGVGEQDRNGVPPLHSGSGLNNLRTRTEAVGGRLDAGVREDGCFHLEVTAPLRPCGNETAGGGPAVSLGGAAA